VAAASTLLQDESEYNRMAQIANPFGDGNSSERILEIVKSYF
jgi:UDP-N-acetylglucosamine 2-epimerase (non-hydrolysing)